MLCVAALAARPGGQVYLGVTCDAILAAKPYASLLQLFSHRADAAAAYLRRVRPSLRVDASELQEGPPKAATLDWMQALVISRETAAGGEAVQEQRAARSFPPLAMLIVDLVGAASQAPLARKLSSSGLRALEAGVRPAEAAGSRTTHARARAQERGLQSPPLPPLPSHDGEESC